MRVGIVTSPRPGRAVDDAHGQSTAALVEGLLERGVSAEPLRREDLGRQARKFDLIDIHTGSSTLAFAAAHAGYRNVVFSPPRPVERLGRWPQARISSAVIARAASVVCRSDAERDALCRLFPQVAGRVHVVPWGIATDALEAARPYALTGNVVIAPAPLNDVKPLRRAIAAMASLDDTFLLVLTGNRPARGRLRGYANDLQVADRVAFVNASSPLELRRWLRTARIAIALGDPASVGSAFSEALLAGAAVIATESAMYREAVARIGGHAVFLRSDGSPLQLADAIVATVGTHRRQLPAEGTGRLSWDAAIAATCDLYDRVVSGRAPRNSADLPGSPRLQVPDAAAVGSRARRRLRA